MDRQGQKGLPWRRERGKPKFFLQLFDGLEEKGGDRKGLPQSHTACSTSYTVCENPKKKEEK